MADDTAVPRDRQIRTEAVHAATRVVAAQLSAGKQVPSGYSRMLAHSFSHYLHAGIWLDVLDDDTLDCPFGDMCRFNRKVEW